MEEGKILSHQQSAGVVKMWLCSLLAMLPFLTSGFYFAYSSMGLPQMLEPNGSGILLDIHQLSWISEYLFLIRIYLTHSLLDGIGYLADIVGLFVTGYLSEKLGRKRMLILGSILQIITCCLIYFCNSFLTITSVFSMFTLTSYLVMEPSYSLLSEVGFSCVLHK